MDRAALNSFVKESRCLHFKMWLDCCRRVYYWTERWQMGADTWMCWWNTDKQCWQSLKKLAFLVFEETEFFADARLRRFGRAKLVWKQTFQWASGVGSKVQTLLHPAHTALSVSGYGVQMRLYKALSTPALPVIKPVCSSSYFHALGL